MIFFANKQTTMLLIGCFFLDFFYCKDACYRYTICKHVHKINSTQKISWHGLKLSLKFLLFDGVWKI